MLNPSILGVCRLLHREGWEVLYQENTLAIELVVRGYPSCHCDICDRHLVRLPVMDMHQSTLIHTDADGDTIYDTKNGAFVRRFRSYELVIDEIFLRKSLRKFEDIIGHLATLLYKQAVNVKIVTSGFLELDADVAQALRILKSFQCSKFKILDITTPLANEIEQAVLLDRPIQLYAVRAFPQIVENMRWLKSQLVHIYSDGLKEQDIAWVESKDREMIAAAERQDLRRFLSARKEIVERFDAENRTTRANVYNDDYQMGCVFPEARQYMGGK